MDLRVLDDTYIRIAGVVPESIVDGPGIRYTIFTQGCPFHCHGCHNPQAQPLNGGMEVKLRVLYDEIKANPLITGVTYSGGEPFIQTRPLITLSKILKEEGYSLWSYSGYTFDKLSDDFMRHELLELLDVVVDGSFVQSLKSLDLDFRGSSNQRIIDVQKSLSLGKVVLAEGFK
mgnify:FL=1